MRIGFDLRPLQLSPGVMGIGVYIKNLIANISSIDKENQYFFLVLKDREFPEVNLSPEFQYELIEIPSASNPYLNVIKDKFTLGSIVSKYSLDLIHFTSPLELKLNFDLGKYNNRSVLTIHDLTPLFYGDLIFRKKRRLLKPLFHILLRNIKKAGHLISVSDNTKKDLIERLKIPPEKITVTHLAADDCFRAIDDEYYLDEIKSKYNLPDKFVMYLGGFSLHKNLNSLIEAMVLLQVEYRLDTPLVIAGTKDSFHLPELEKRISELGLTDRVYFPGFIPTVDLPAVYNLASVFVFPSMYEGFGLPPLEAMKCGTPTIVSNTSSLPEIAGSSAIVCNSRDIESLAESMHRILSSVEIADDLKKKGILRAMDFSWEKCARETLDVYKNLSCQ
ncbi:MAG: glycosyltransferase family 4 protein [Candidatus Eremiobacteraeota bacterium]|nr:glycosyltransferase family 4 protein [Candidatus Eremiobacteraeota bacterium]